MFELLWNKPDGLPAREIIAFIPELVKLTDYERAISSTNGLPKYEGIIRVATVPLTTVGWLRKSNKGRWYLTEQGRQACKKYTGALELYKEALRIYDERGRGRPEVTMVFEAAQEKAWEHIQKFLQAAGLAEFQALVADLLRAMNYHVLWIARADKEPRPIDIVASVDQIGANGVRILVQIKHKGQAVTIEGLRSALSALGPHDFGLLISTGGFTAEVWDAIQSREYQRINALDLERLFDLWISNHDKLSQEARNRLPIKPVHFLAPVD